MVTHVVEVRHSSAREIPASHTPSASRNRLADKDMLLDLPRRERRLVLPHQTPQNWAALMCSKRKFFPARVALRLAAIVTPPRCHWE